MWCTLTTARVTPASARRSNTWSSSAWPATFTSGFGSVSVSGRMRVPKPAASTMARVGLIKFLLLRRRRNVGVVPLLQIAHRRMNQRAAQVAPYARDVTEILRFAVAPVEPRENAEDFRGALRAERHI